MKDIETAVIAALQGDDLPEGFDLPAAVQQVLDRNDLEHVGRLTLRYLLERNLARLLTRRTVILAAAGKPSCH